MDGITNLSPWPVSGPAIQILSLADARALDGWDEPSHVRRKSVRKFNPKPL
jgi:hypothetical protein